MSYVDENLLPGEQVVYRAKLHWSLFSLPMAWAIVGLLLCLFGITDDQVVALVLGLLFLLAAVLTLPGPWITYRTTEMAITTQRIIAKRGWIRRDTLEVEHRGIGGVQVKQGVMDRIFNRGTVTITSAGAPRSGFPGIAKPLDFRRNALQAKEAAQRR